VIDEPIVFIDDSSEPEPIVAAEVDPGTGRPDLRQLRGYPRSEH
jgi:hypothetical protein